jgi:ketosteroid isomerase-like protein
VNVPDVHSGSDISSVDTPQWELAARDAIRQLVADYTHMGDGGRLDEMILLFDDDAVVDTAQRRFTGHDEITGFFAGIVDGTSPGPRRSFIRHFIANHSIDVTSPTTATGAAYWLVISDVGLESSGRYRDSYRRGDDGRWRFATRKIRADESRLPPSS